MEIIQEPQQIQNYEKSNQVGEDGILFRSGTYTVSIARNSCEVEKALSLRYEVFCEEFQKGGSVCETDRIESDVYDFQCHHLLVTDNSKDLVVGTYRLQTYEMAMAGLGFYSDQEFDLSAFPTVFLKRSVEIGRACIQMEYRNSRVLFLLWKGLAAYLKKMRKSVLFGCCSLYSDNYRSGWQLFNLLKENGSASNDFFVKVRPDYDIPAACDIDLDKQASEKVEMPLLFEKYLNIGAKVASAPAFDHDFGTIDYLVYLKLTETNKNFLQFIRRGLD